MSDEDTPAIGRRTFLKSAGVAAVTLPVLVANNDGKSATPDKPIELSQAQLPPAAPAPSPIPATTTAGYQKLSLDEAAFTEALVDHMWPKDGLSASGTELGIATFIDRQLAGAFGQGDRLYLQGPFRKGKPQHGYQLPLTPAQHYTAGIGAATTACQKRFNKSFDKISSVEREQFLQDIAGGKVKEGSLDLAAWFNGLVYPLFAQGAFADPIYGGNRDKAAWKMIGYPGLPSVYQQDVVRYRGKPHPRSADPKSIQDFS
jgi:gluconate 2-dehydrogenase gamma chain